MVGIFVSFSEYLCRNGPPERARRRLLPYRITSYHISAEYAIGFEKNIASKSDKTHERY
jgi:hypothetical protein